MKEDSKVLDIIVEELTEAKDTHAVPRRTLIKPDEGGPLTIFLFFLSTVCAPVLRDKVLNRFFYLLSTLYVPVLQEEYNSLHQTNQTSKNNILGVGPEK